MTQFSNAKKWKKIYFISFFFPFVFQLQVWFGLVWSWSRTCLPPLDILYIHVQVEELQFPIVFHIIYSEDLFFFLYSRIDIFLSRPLWFIQFYKLRDLFTISIVTLKAYTGDIVNCVLHTIRLLLLFTLPLRAVPFWLCRIHATRVRCCRRRRFTFRAFSFISFQNWKTKEKRETSGVLDPLLRWSDIFLRLQNVLFEFHRIYRKYTKLLAQSKHSHIKH